MRKVTISCVTDYAYLAEDSQTNDEIVLATIAKWDIQINKVLPDKPDLLILPELCDRPKINSISPAKQIELMQSGNPKFLNYLQGIAKAHNTYIVYPSYRIDSEGNLKNSNSIIDRKGVVIASYDKNHLVIAESTELGIQYSDDSLVLDLDFGRVGFAICFDLNFTELLEKYRYKGVEVLIFTSEYHGGLMQNYWAYQLRAFFAGAIRPPAPCSIVSPLGELVAKSTNYHNYISGSINLNYFIVHLDENWDKITLMREKYGNKVSVIDPGQLGVVMVALESEELIREKIIEEFGFLLIDDYLKLSRQHRLKDLAL
jgi:Carbon-nitrogen hydrolase